MKDKITKQYELACKYGVYEKVRFYRMLFGGEKVINYLKKCIKVEEKLLKEQCDQWIEFEGDIKSLLKK